MNQTSFMIVQRVCIFPGKACRPTIFVTRPHQKQKRAQAALFYGSGVQNQTGSQTNSSQQPFTVLLIPFSASHSILLLDPDGYSTFFLYVKGLLL
jgi:hypothetical protein